MKTHLLRPAAQSNDFTELGYPLNWRPRRWLMVQIGLVTTFAALGSTQSIAEVRKVGHDVGVPGGTCQFSSLQEAIDDLPVAGAHQLIIEDGTYSGTSATINVDGRSIEVRTAFAKNSGCNTVNQSSALLTGGSSTLDRGRLVVVKNDGELILSGIDISGPSSGAVLVTDGELEMQRGSIYDSKTSQATQPGAGIHLVGGKVILRDVSLFGNASAIDGGAIYCTAGSDESSSEITLLGDVAFSNNRAIDGSGGAIFMSQACQLSVLDTQAGLIHFDGNIASRDGGAIAASSASSEGGQNYIAISAATVFSENRATRNGGAIALADNSSLIASVRPAIRFERNHAARFGGAIYTGAPTAKLSVDRAIFLENSASRYGGAIAASSGRVRLSAACNPGENKGDEYCAYFRRNQIDEAKPTQARKGGAFYVGGDGVLTIDGYAISESRGPLTSSELDQTGGVLGTIEDVGHFTLKNSLVFDHFDGSGEDSNLFQFNGGEGLFSFNTMVDADTFGGTILVGEGAKVSLVGNIIDGNGGGVVGSGELSGACNNVQLGTNPAPFDPGFATTSAGRYRLAGDSKMINRGTTCHDFLLPPDYEFPAMDLDGNQRIVPGEFPKEMDLGAFEYVPPPEIFSSSFERLPGLL